jgi:GNAT superfamily N-acetyltransferase
MTDNLTVRQAGPDDMGTILGMIEEAADWLSTKGTDQWAVPWPTRKRRDNRVVRGLKKKKTWIVEDAGAPIATVTLRQQGNRKLWTATERREPAVYLSRLIVGRDYAGQAIGEALIDWAGLRGARDWDAQWIRIDVWTTNVALHNYYEKRGFRPYGDRRLAKISSYPSAALFQKPITEVDEAAAARFRETANRTDVVGFHMPNHPLPEQARA